MAAASITGSRAQAVIKKFSSIALPTSTGGTSRQISFFHSSGSIYSRSTTTQRYSRFPSPTTTTSPPSCIITTPTSGATSTSRSSHFSTSVPRRAVGDRNPADDPNFMSILDNPPVLVRSGGPQHGPGLILLALIPLTAIALGTWQIYRLKQKTILLSRYEDRILRPPLPLPNHIDPSVIPEFDYRRVNVTGKFLHNAEMLVGPRLLDGEDGYLVITPFQPVDSVTGEAIPNSAILVNRGWIPKSSRSQESRALAFEKAVPNGSLKADVLAFPTGLIQIQGLLRKPWKKNMFTPENTPTQGKWYFPDVVQMAEWAGTQPVWIEQTVNVVDNTLLQQYDRQARGIPIMKTAEVNLVNNHLQYIVTWYALGLATSVMFWLVVKKPPSGEAARRVRRSVEW